MASILSYYRITLVFFDANWSKTSPDPLLLVPSHDSTFNKSVSLSRTKDSLLLFHGCLYWKVRILGNSKQQHLTDDLSVILDTLNRHHFPHSAALLPLDPPAAPRLLAHGATRSATWGRLCGGGHTGGLFGHTCSRWGRWKGEVGLSGLVGAPEKRKIQEFTVLAPSSSGGWVSIISVISLKLFVMDRSISSASYRRIFWCALSLGSVVCRGDGHWSIQHCLPRHATHLQRASGAYPFPPLWIVLGMTHLLCYWSQFVSRQHEDQLPAGSCPA